MNYRLLDHLAQTVGVEYLSEMKNKACFQGHSTYIDAISDDAYTLDDWKDTCNYLLGDSSSIDCIADAKKRILDWMK